MQTSTGIFQDVKGYGESYRIFVPPSPFSFAEKLDPYFHHIDHAMRSLGKLDAISSFLPDINLFIYLYVRKEALLSSQIEGTQSSLADIFMYEDNMKPTTSIDDIEEVTNYISAINYGLDKIKKNNFPFSLRLIKEIHGILLRGVRGQEKSPGDFRTTQNWIGGTRPGNAIFVPPPPEKVLNLMGDFEKYAHSPQVKIPALIKLAILHHQFETIHPFLDGNGRLGRLLIPLLLCDWGLLSNPILYISFYLKIHRAKYYDLLQEVRTTGKWNNWITFFLEGIQFTAEEGCLATKKLVSLIEEDEKKISHIKNGADSVKLVFSFMKQHPIVNIPDLSQKLEISPHTSKYALEHLEKLNIIKEITGKKRGKLYTYDKYISILSEGSTPL
jgi:Fic family protein